MLLSPEPRSILTKNNKTLEEFALKYGKEGLLYSLSDHAVLKIKQLDFSNVAYADECMAIPNDEKKNYMKSICGDPQVYISYNSGAQYNVPIEEKKWINIQDIRYQKYINSYPVIGYV